MKASVGGGSASPGGNAIAEQKNLFVDDAEIDIKKKEVIGSK